MRKVRFVFSLLAVVGIGLPAAAFAAAPATAPTVTDVALVQGGLLQGQVVNPVNGSGMANVPVTLRTQDQIVASTTTGADGRFAIQGVRGGVHQVVAGEGQGIYRFWAPGTAPPAAQVKAVVYTQTAVAETSPNVPVTYTGCDTCTGSGQGGGAAAGGGFKRFITNPWVIGGVVATAIAVPVALNNSGHSDSD
jgi:hypothetical protein